MSWLLLVVLGCAGGEPLSGTAANPHVILEVPGQKMRIQIPMGTPMKKVGRGRELTLDPDGRSPKNLHISKDRGAPPEKEGWSAPITLELANRAELEYRTQTTEGGSGGEETVLAGRLAIGERAWSVVCRTQNEGEADFAWCFELLGTVTPVD